MPIGHRLDEDSGKAPAVAEQEFRAQLFLVVEAGDGARERLAAALGTGAASVLIVPAAGKSLQARMIAPLVADAQSAGAAALVLADAALAREVNADGVHLPTGSGADLAEAYEQARRTLGTQSIVGIDAGISRHDAMTLGEAGADYIGFGIPSGVQDIEAARTRRLDLVAWWSEIFEIPCVALEVETSAEALDLLRAGADFIGIRLANGCSPSQVAEEMRRMSEALAGAMTV